MNHRVLTNSLKKTINCMSKKLLAIVNMKRAKLCFISLFALSSSLFTPQYCGAQFTVLHNFNDTAGGNAGDGFLAGSLYLNGSYLYGMAEAGGQDTGEAGCGSQGWGVIFKIMTNGSGYDTLYNLDSAGGGNPVFSSFISDGTYLYGMTSGGDPYCGGSIFKIKPNGTNFDTIATFSGLNGLAPFGTPVYDGTFLYGMTNLGGSDGDGNIFKIMPNGTGYADMYDFSGTSGESPNGSLIYDGTWLYGMTETAGGVSTAGYGSIFKIMPNGTNFTVLYVFNDTMGANPYGSLVLYKDYLYGMAQGGGAENYGDVFKIKTDGSGFDTLFSFTNTNGSTPYGSLIAIGANLYGMTSLGGATYAGTIFKVDTNGTGYADLFDFDGIDDTTGLNPTGNLTFDGTYLYGMTGGGGTYGAGTIFRFGTSSLGIEKITSGKGNVKVYPNPSKGEFTIESSGVSSQWSVEVYNVLGEQVYSSNYPLSTNHYSLDLSSNPNGIYFYRVIANNGNILGEGKLIIQK